MDLEYKEMFDGMYDDFRDSCKFLRRYFKVNDIGSLDYQSIVKVAPLIDDDSRREFIYVYKKLNNDMAELPFSVKMDTALNIYMGATFSMIADALPSEDDLKELTGSLEDFSTKIEEEDNLDKLSGELELLLLNAEPADGTSH